jgi:hypothetical protein
MATMISGDPHTVTGPELDPSKTRRSMLSLGTRPNSLRKEIQWLARCERDETGTM